jgi:hypothetical protein
VHKLTMNNHVYTTKNHSWHSSLQPAVASPRGRLKLNVKFALVKFSHVKLPLNLQWTKSGSSEDGRYVVLRVHSIFSHRTDSNAQWFACH